MDIEVKLALVVALAALVVVGIALRKIHTARSMPPMRGPDTLPPVAMKRARSSGAELERLEQLLPVCDECGRAYRAEPGWFVHRDYALCPAHAELGFSNPPRSED